MFAGIVGYIAYSIKDGNWDIEIVSSVVQRDILDKLSQVAKNDISRRL